MQSHSHSHIYKFQRLLKNKFISYSKELRKKGVSNSPYLYGCTWYKNLSFYKLNTYISAHYYIFVIVYFFKEFFYSIFLFKSKLNIPKKKKEKKFTNLYITWNKIFDIKKKNIISNQEFFSKNFNKDINNNKNLIYSLSLTDNIFHNTSDNIYILESNFGLNYNKIKFFFTFVVLKIIKSIFTLNVHRININSLLSEIVCSHIISILEKNDIKNIYLRYEGQQIQNYLIFMIRKKFKNISIVGTVKAHLPVPLYLYYNTDSPDYLICDSLDQVFFLKRLGWSKEKLIYQKKVINKKINGIYLPFQIHNHNKIINSFLEILNSKYGKFFSDLKIFIHPNSFEPNNNILYYKLNDILKDFLKKNNRPQPITKKISKEKYSIVFGPSSVVYECLKSNHSVIQIFDNPIFECMTKYFWPNVNLKFITKNSVLYKLN